jgi:hypothetical protein
MHMLTFYGMIYSFDYLATSSDWLLFPYFNFGNASISYFNIVLRVGDFCSERDISYVHADTQFR